MENCSKIARFSTKMAQKAPRDRSSLLSIIHIICQDMKAPFQKKEFLNYPP